MSGKTPAGAERTEWSAARFGARYGTGADEIAVTAARDLAAALTVMLGERCAAAADANLAPDSIRIDAPREFADRGPIEISAAPGANLLHAAWEYLARLGATLPVGRPPRLPRIEPARLYEVSPRATAPAFARRALVADLMTWHYEQPDRFAAHLAHDREFIPWMAARGINAFSWLRHERDTRLKIDELLPLMRARGVAPEYGGHVLQLLMPRGEFAAHPEFFPLGADGARNPRGNLCVANPDALAVVRDGAIAWAEANPEGAILHVWGADVRQGAWCRCGECAALGPRRQYLRVVNAIAGALAARGIATPVAYLAYHDTIDPDPALAPLDNVVVEWAPRERCHSHAIDDSGCAVNRRYFESLQRYAELFGGRVQIFEYYADAILFGGLGCATPAVIARDLRAYHALGASGVSCLTFGAYSMLAYPINLEAFARGARAPDFAPGQTFADVAAGLHPQCAAAMADAYRAIARASALILDPGGDVMQPPLGRADAPARIAALRAAGEILAQAIAAADAIATTASDRLGAAERAVWQYGREVVDGLAEYIAAAADGPERSRRGAAAIARIAGAVVHLRAADERLKGTWGAHDIEWLREIWLAALRRKFGRGPATGGAA